MISLFKKDTLKQFLSRDFVFYFGLIFLIILIGELPIILRIFHTPQGYYYPLLDNITNADYYYPALIRQGMGSQWLTHVPYIPYEHPGSTIQILFILLGKLSKFTGVGPAEMFVLSKIFGAGVYILSASLLIRALLKKYQARFAFLFFLFNQPLPFYSLSVILGNAFGVWEWVWVYGEAVKKFTSLPIHYTLGKGLAILSLFFLYKYFHTRKKDLLLFASLFIIIGGIIYAPPVFILFFSLIGAFFVYVLLNKQNLYRLITRAQKEIAIIYYPLSCLLPLLLLKLELNKGYPWNMWVTTDLTWNDPQANFELKYLQMTGFLLILSLFSLGELFRPDKRNFWKIFLFIWAASPFFLFPFATTLGLSKFRLIEGAQIVPLSILGYWGLENIFNHLGKFFTWQIVQKARYIFLFLFLIYSLAIISLVTRNSTIHLWSYWRNIYIHPDEIEALSYLNTHAVERSVVLAEFYPSNFIPAFANARTIIGFSDFYTTQKYAYEKQQIDGILNGNLPEDEVLKYLKTRNVSYIYKENFIYGEKLLYPKILETVFHNRSFDIYKVKKY